MLATSDKDRLNLDALTYFKRELAQNKLSLHQI